MNLKLQIGLNAITSYKRLAYTPWHAIAEFIDNSTQSYFDNKDTLDKALAESGESLHVSIVYDKGGVLRVSDNAMGMSQKDLQRALCVAYPPENTSGRSRYGMGLKTSACWIGNLWTIKTKKLGETVEHTVTIDVDTIASGNNQLPYRSVDGKRKGLHYTVIEIREHNQVFHGRTLGKIRDFLRSMYREDFRNNVLTLEWNGDPLTWEELDDRLLVAHDGSRYKQEFKFTVDHKRVSGWVGILDRGSRADAGFAIIYRGRVVKGWPDAWRPERLYGQYQGSNDLVNQRLVGEIHLDDFEVSHTKDAILWLGSQEEDVEKQLYKYCADYRDIALKRRKGKDDERGPSEIEVNTAIDELKKELLSPEMVDRISIEEVPSEQVISEAIGRLTQSVTSRRKETFRVKIGEFAVKVYVDNDLSPNDPYVVGDATKPSEVIVIINSCHPHWSQLKGAEGVLNYMRHCTYDSVAEWKARHKTSRIDPDTIKMLKDGLLRVPFEIEEHATDEDGD
jgi:hypothetical protein